MILQPLGIALDEQAIRAVSKWKMSIRKTLSVTTTSSTKKVADLLLVAQHTAKPNDRIALEPRDLPITKGLQESIHAFEALDLDIGLERILEKADPEPQMDLPYSDETEARLPAIVGGLSLALARTFKIIDPQLKHPRTQEWERAFRIFELLL